MDINDFETFFNNPPQQNPSPDITEDIVKFSFDTNKSEIDVDDETIEGITKSINEYNTVWGTSLLEGAMVGAPILGTHKRHKNWMARIRINPKSDFGGLDREFVPRAKLAGLTYIVEDLKVGMSVEFAADYHTGSGNRSPKRWYGVITVLNKFKIEIQRYASAREACTNAFVPRKPGDTDNGDLTHCLEF